MPSETSQEKIERYMGVLKLDVPPQSVVVDPEMPTLLVEFFFARQTGGPPPRFDSRDIDDMRGYLNKTLTARRSEIEMARTRLRVAACMNNLAAVSHYRRVVGNLSAVIQAFESMDKQIMDTHMRMQGIVAGGY